MYDTAKITKLLMSLQEEAENILLFLKSVETLEIYTWPEGSKSPLLSYRCSVQNLTMSIRASRNLFASASQVSMPSSSVSGGVCKCKHMQYSWSQIAKGVIGK